MANQFGKWNSATKKPKKSGKYLACDGVYEKPFIAKYKYGKWFRFECDKYAMYEMPSESEFTPTYWMELPKTI